MEIPQPIRIRTAKDLFDALRSSDSSARLAMLRAIIRAPQKAAAYGKSGGRDLIDELCDQARTLVPSPLRALVLGALVAYRDSRVRALFMEEINASEDAETLTLAARYLAGEVSEAEQRTLCCLLLQERSLEHARAAASVMAGLNGLGEKEQLRGALLGVGGFVPPRLDRQSEALWMSALAGPHAERARALLIKQGEAAFLYFRKTWESLGETDKNWILGWGASRFPAYTVELILSALETGPDALQVAALEAIVTLGTAGQLFLPHTGRFLVHPKPAVRLAAAKAGASAVDWEAAFDAELDAEVRRELLLKLAETKGAAATPTLVRVIEEGDYRLCAVATSALISFGTEVADSVKPLLDHPRQAVQVAAAQVLIGVGEETWLETWLLR